MFYFLLFQLSLANNHIVDIKGVSAATGLKVLDLSNNSIVSIEGILSLLLYYRLLSFKYCSLASLDMVWSCAPFFGRYILLALTLLILHAFIWQSYANFMISQIVVWDRVFIHHWHLQSQKKLMCALNCVDVPVLENLHFIVHVLKVSVG